MQAWSPSYKSLHYTGRGAPRENHFAASTADAPQSQPLVVSLKTDSDRPSLDPCRTHHRRPSSPLSTPSPSYPRTPSESPSPRDSFMDEGALKAPHKPFARSRSPSGDSASTISPATTPRGFKFPKQEQPPQTKASKRASVDRRMNALKGLVAQIDFGEVFSSTDEVQETEEDVDTLLDVYDGYCRMEDVAGLHEEPKSNRRVSPPMKYPQPEARRSSRALSRKPSAASVVSLASSTAQSQPSQATSSLRSNASYQDLASASVTRRPRSTIVKSKPATLRHARSTSDVKMPIPRPPSRQRTEFFPVATSGYSSTFDDLPACNSSRTGGSWRATFATEREYALFVASHGQSEAARQEVIWELCETERTFVADLQHIVRVFSKPLQTPQGRWMEGIPMQVATAFGAVSDIAAVHAKIADCLSRLQARSRMVDVSNLVNVLEPLISDLKVHEWLLVHFAEVNTCVDGMVNDASCVFGEFIRMQLGVVDCKAQSLGDLLHKPMQRLMKYPLFLMRLLEMTPSRTSTYQQISRLRSSIDNVISSLQVAKTAHEDLISLRRLESRIEGLPSDFTLSKPGRRILLDCEAQRILSSASDLGKSQSRSRQSSFSSRSSPDVVSSRSSVISNASSFACASSSSHSRSNSATTALSLSRSPSFASSRSTGSRGENGVGSLGASGKTSAVRLLVLDDVVLLLALKRERKLFARRASSTLESFVVAPSVGLSRVVDVQEVIGSAGHTMLAVSLLPFSRDISDVPETVWLAASQRTSLSTISTALMRSAPPLPSPVLMSSPGEEVLSPQFDWEELAREVRRKRSVQ